MTPTPSAVHAAHDAWLADSIATLEAGVESAKDGMRVDGDHRPASRGERGAVSAQGALRAGLLARIAELTAARQQLAALDPGATRPRVCLGALVQVEDEDGAASWLAILPGGQGSPLPVDGGPVRVVSLDAPIARALLGREAGDVVELVRPSGEVELEVLSVC